MENNRNNKKKSKNIFHTLYKLIFDSFDNPEKPRQKLVKFILFAGFLTVFVYLIYIMLINGPRLKNQALSQIENIQELEPKRGNIFDRNGNIMAASAESFKVDADLNYMKKKATGNDYLDPNKMTREEETKFLEYAKQASIDLAYYVNKSQEEVYELLTYKNKDNVYLSSTSLGNKLEINTLAELKELKKVKKYSWLIINDDSKRYYPNNNLMSHVVGFTNGDGFGQYGIELYYDNYLKGIPGIKISETDAVLDDLPFREAKVTEPVNGADVNLTLDEKIQYIIEKIARDSLAEFQAKNVIIIVSKPQTGEILGLVNYPDFDLNNPQGDNNSEDIYNVWKNNAVEEPFEPGSTFKILTMASALSQNIVNPNSTFECPGYSMVDGVKIWCALHTGHGHETLADLMKNSCNTGFIEIGQEMGINTLNEYIKKFGLTSTTGIDLPNEAQGIIKDSESVSNVDLAAISIGQTNKLTAIQSLTNLNIVLNKGKIIKPHVVRDVTRKNKDGNFETLYKFNQEEVEDILDDNVSDIVIDQLKYTGKEGGASAAQVDGIDILGKTGTAEKINPQTGKYEFYISSFVGAAPADNPEISVYIAVDSPTGNGYGSVVSAPMAKKVFEETLKYLGKGNKTN